MPIIAEREHILKLWKKLQTVKTKSWGTKKKGGHPILLQKEQDRMPEIAEREHLFKLWKKLQTLKAKS